MTIKNYLEKYINRYQSVIKLDDQNKKKILSLVKLIKKYKKKKTIHIFGNGGSAAIASHFSMDLTNNSNIKCVTYNSPEIITCYSNDFGYENWVSRVVDKYGNKDDLAIFISSSGKSQNMINGIKKAKSKKFYKVITFTGFKKNNPLKKIGDINFWVNSEEYNIIENAHQFYLFMIVDIIKKFKN